MRRKRLALSSGLAIFFVLWGVLSAPAQAEQCSPIDFREKLGPVRDQSDIGWCYAFVAADLLGAYYGRLPVRSAGGKWDLTPRFSAADIALSYNRKYRPYAIAEGGQVVDAMSAALERGLCRERDIKSEEVVYNQLGTTATGLRKVFVATQSRFNGLLSTGLREQEDAYVAAATSVFNVDEQFVRSLKDDPTMSTQNLLYTLQTQACVQRRFKSLSTPQIQIWRAWLLNQDFSGFVDRRLERMQPVSISFWPKVLAYGVHVPPQPHDPSHIATIVGRRKTERGCEYLVRNSWGTGCQYYYSGFKCEGGHVWVPESTLSPAVFQAVGLE